MKLPYWAECTPWESVMAKGKSKSSRLSRLDLLLVLGLLAVFLVIAVPRWHEEHQRSRLSCLHSDLARLRTAIEAYTVEHRAPPGVRNEQVSSEILVEQLLLRTDALGQSHPRGPFGPYLPAGMPYNPFNGLDNVWLVESESLPRPDARTGWVFHLASGEFHANVPLVTTSSGEAVFDL